MFDRTDRGACSRARVGSVRISGLLSIAVVLTILIAGASSASAASSPLKVSVARSSASLTGAVFDFDRSLGLAVSVKTAASSRCALTVQSKKAKVTFPELLTNGRGTGSWGWLAADQAPAGSWSFRALCHKASKTVRGSTTAFLFTPNTFGTNGALFQRSTTTIRSGRLAQRPKLVRPRHLRTRAVAQVSEANTYPPGQCTWYAKVRRPDIPNYMGNAGGWLSAARARGFPTGFAPQAGAIVVWLPYKGGAGGYGHVGYVEQVLSGNRLLVADSNWGGDLRPRTHIVSATSVSGYIYRRGVRPGAPPPPPFSASLDAEFPQDGLNQVFVTAGGAPVTFGYNVRFNQPFSVPNFVMRPTTASTINRFSTVTGDFPGAQAPNDGQVGYYRAQVRAPAGTPSGTYFMQWNVIHTGTGQFSGLQPSFKLVVLPPGSSGQPQGSGGISCPPPAPGGPFQLSADPSFTATLDAEFPQDANNKVYAPRGGSVAIGYNVRFNQAFSVQNFLLRTDTPGTINYFSNVKGDWPGAVAPNDSHVGYYRASLIVPSCTPPGDYFLRWNPINMANGKWAGIQPSLILEVQ